MLIKFETKSARVKAITFHSRRTWLLASLHNGVIQLWDYSEKTLLEKFDEHKGPVRGLDFHTNQPLFVSGGDDSKIKVWNYKSRRCLFTLDAHEDYIRTTFFHRQEPWIVSCSDDQSIRIWNWINRTKINLLTGHTHYVMCAQFHPANDLILSASIDQTLRLWDISNLRNKSSSSNSKDEIGLPEILSKTDYSVESKDAHNSEINWCCFHPDPRKQMCLSTADDTYIKLWKIDPRGGLREIDTLRGHYNHVNCALFHPKKDLILSASDDRSIRVWDIDKRSPICTHRKEVDRFWAIAAHPTENLFAAGHDNGLLLFKLERERPVFCVIKDYILFIKNNQIFHHNMKSNQTRSVLSLKNKTELTHQHHGLHCHSYGEKQPCNILVSTRSVNINNSIVDFYKIPSNQLYNQSQGLSAVFVGKDKYAILDKSKRVIFKVGQAEKNFDTIINGNEIYDAGTGRLFVKNKEDDVVTITLWDLETMAPIHSLKFDPKFVLISQNKKFIACLGKNRILICDGQLNVLTTIEESRKIKSAVWDESGVLFYNTPFHIKYALVDGDTTIVRSVEQTLYLISIRDNKLFYINRNGDVKAMAIYPAEFKFKQAVIKNNKSAILSALKELKTPTRAELSFLVKKGYADIALRYVQDPKTRFSLAIQALKLDIALDSAIKLNDKKCWDQLAEAAMDVGHVFAAERAYIELKEPYKLALLYHACDQRDKIIEARDYAREWGDPSTEFVISLLLKDFEAVTRIIHRFQPSLGYTCAVNHGLYDLAKEYRKEFTDEQLDRLPPLEKALTADLWMLRTIPDIGNSPFKNWPQPVEDEEEAPESLPEETEPEELEDELVEEEEEEEEEMLEDDDMDDNVVNPSTVNAQPLNNDIIELRAKMASWSVQDVVEFIESHEDIKNYSVVFEEDEVDGKALLLMIDRNLNPQMLAPMFKRGPAMKIEAALSKYKA